MIGVVLLVWLFLQGAHAGYTCASELTPGATESVTPGLPTPTPSPTPSATPVPSITAVPSVTGAPSGSTAPTAPPTGSPTTAPSPTPSATPVAEPTPRLGFSTGLLGRNHVPLNTVINYAFCPPTSGDHYNDPPNHGPIRAAVYPANEEQVPGGWLHNMEHGYVVALYRCPSGVLGQGDCISQAELDQMQAFFDQVPDSVNPVCPTKVVVARFDTMTTKFALLAWGRAFLTDTFDLDTALLFNQQWQDQPAAPERGSC
ncbi:MAG: hypothetical protein QOJ81_389 [Chloroflexota bacterium]|nr:hypothetical protein [Chloroflexota bacterium]